MKEYRQPSESLRIADIGVFCGSGSLIFWSELPLISYVAIEDWNAAHQTEWAANAQRRYLSLPLPAGIECKLMRMPRHEAAEQIPDGSLDFVYIEKASRADILSWLPKLAPGGAMGGHDYSAYQNLRFGWSVVEDVNSVFYVPDEVFEDTSWLVWPTSMRGRCRTGNKRWWRRS